MVTSTLIKDGDALFHWRTWKTLSS